MDSLATATTCIARRSRDSKLAFAASWHSRRWYNADMSTISLQDLERDPVGCLNRVEAGESILVTRDDRPVAELRPVATNQRSPRPFGLAAGMFDTPADFDAPLPDDVIQGFEAR